MDIIAINLNWLTTIAATDFAAFKLSVKTFPQKIYCPAQQREIL